MNAAVMLVFSIAVLGVGYFVYGGWLSRQWGIDGNRTTPAHKLEDGLDYVPAKAPVLMGHHFSSIAGAGPITGPIQAAIFGWLPVLLWVLIGGIFMGGVHDFGALFSSMRNDGKSIGEVISDTMGEKAKKVFIIFAYLTLLLVVAAFASIVASTFGVTNMKGAPVSDATREANMVTAMISFLFIALAVCFGLLVYKVKVSIGFASVIGVVGIVAITALGFHWHPVALSYDAWMYIIGLYIAVASVTPVWILLQPRDYLSSFLIYFMIAVALVAIIGASLTGHGNLDIPAFLGSFTAPESNGLFTMGTLFPALFVTIACGAMSGLHSLVASGTTAKQIDNEKSAQPIAYGSMLVECVVAVISLCAVGYCWDDIMAAGKNLASVGLAAPTAVFATGISRMLGTFTNPDAQHIAYNMLVLTVSVFCLTSLDTATRLARYMFQELCLTRGQTVEDLTGIKKFLANPYVSTVITAVLGIALGLTGYTKIWPLFGAANQLLAAVGLLAVCAWLGHVGRNNRMFYIPMGFMLVVTIVSLCQTIAAKAGAIEAAETNAAIWLAVQAGISALLIALAVYLAVDGIKIIMKQNREKEIAN